MTALETLTGTVVNVNRTGFQLDSQPDVWVNPSRFADPPPPIPALGSRVAVAVDGKGFARTITPLEGTAPVPGGASRDQTITRLACLKSAVHFLADKSEAKSPDVLRVAALFEEWVTR